MANNNVQPTHENIHTGLSGLNNDEKWKDMLNFRSQQKKTVVVPHKFLVVNNPCARLHTILPGLSGHNLAIGKHQSFGFVGGENMCPYPLWRVKQRYLGELGERDSQSQRLVVQGSYTGHRPTKIRVHYIKGQLVPFWNVPPEPEPVVEPPPIDYGCGVDFAAFKVSGTITDQDTTDPIADVLVEFIRFGFVQYSLYTNAFGKFEIDNFESGFYTFRLRKDNYFGSTEDLTLAEETVLDRALYTKVGREVWTSGIYSEGEVLVARTEFPFVYDTSTALYCEADHAYPAFDDTDTKSTIGGGGNPWVIVYSWAANTASGTWPWGVGELAYRGSTIYLCDTAHDANALAGVADPGTGSSWATYWSVFAALPTTAIEWDERSDSFVENDTVIHNDHLYECILAHTTSAATEPGVGVDWEDYWTLLV